MHLEPILEVSKSLLHMMDTLTIFEASTMISNNIGDAIA
jgi:hypothetical protein